MKEITNDEAQEFISPFIGKTINRVWQGYGSAIFVEIGELSEGGKGELTIMVEGSWRIEGGNQISFGSWSDSTEFYPKLLDKINGLTFKSISFQGRLPEISVELSNDIWVCSFSTVAGDPEWGLLASGKTIVSCDGALGYE